MKSSELSGTGCVVAHYGVAVAVRLESGQEGRVRVSGKTPLRVGDRVVVEDSTLIRVTPAKGVLSRRDSHGRIRSVAANLDALGIVISPRPESPEGFVDRGLVAARAAGLDALVVINKADLGEAAALRRAVEERYADGVKTLLVSAMSGLGLDALGVWLGEGRRGVFVGTSGVGKSSLLNALLPELDLAVGEINDVSGLGRHVTSTATLHRLPTGGELIDTPGFRDFGPVEVSPAELAAFFPGFEEGLGRGCRFRNCLHRGEPDCGVKDELEAGSISPARHAGYLALLAELEAIGGDRR